MGFMDEIKKIIHPYDDEDYDYEDEELEQPEKNDSRSIFDDRREERRQPEERHNKVVNIHATAALKVVLVKPERFENASEIADHLREKRLPVRRSLCRRRQDQEGGRQYLYHHALQRGYHGRPDRRTGKQRPVSVSGRRNRWRDIPC